MRMTIFGATGRTGRLVVEKALESGHTVTVLVRSPEKLTLRHSDLTVLQGALDDSEKMDQAIAGADVVISTLGPVCNKATHEISRATGLIIESILKRGVRRLLITAGAGVSAPGDQPKLIDKMIVRLLKTVNGNVFDDMVQTVEMVKESGLEWTIVRVPRLTDAAASGKMRRGAVGKDIGTTLTRADLAALIIEMAQDPASIGSMSAFSN